MDAARKSFELQAQVRHNAEEYKNSLNELYSWEKEIKEKEKKMQSTKTAETAEIEEHKKTLPVRSHVEQPASNKQTKATATAETTNGERNDEKTKPEEQIDTSKEPLLDPHAEKRTRADEIKDRGNKHVQLCEYQKAIEEYSAAIEVYPEDPVYYSNRALCYLKLERYDECILDCDSAVEINNTAVKAYYRRMQANESLGNYMDALKDCTTVLMIDPKNIEAKKSLERINERLRKNAMSTSGPNFSALRKNMIDILPIEKPPYKRSKAPLKRVPITDVVGPKDTKNYENSNLQISDDDIDKLFNSNCGPFVEVKKKPETAAKTTANKTATRAKEETKSKSLSNNRVLPAKEEEQVADVAAIATAPMIDSNKISPTTVAKNIVAATKKEELLINANRPLPPAPTSTAQFYSNWKELQPAQKYLYLKSIDIPHLCKVLGAGFDSDTLTDIVLTLRDYYLTNNESTTASTLLEVSKNNQIAILSLLMSKDDRKVLTEIVNSIKESKVNASIAQMIAKNFNLN